MTPDEDPGWPLSTRTLLSVVAPWLALHDLRRRERAGADGLVLLRQMFLSFSVALVLFGVVLAGLEYEDERLGPVPFAAGLGALGAVSQLAFHAIRRPLDCTSEATLGASYRVEFFLALAFAELPALVGFVGVFLTGAPWVYDVGFAWAVVGFARLAPTRGNLRRRQDALALAGCGRSLVGAVRAAGAAPRRASSPAPPAPPTPE